MKTIIKIIIIIIIIISYESLMFSKNKKKDDENRLQIGFGLISYSNVMMVLKSIKKFEAINSNTDYNYPTTTKEQNEAFNSMDAVQQRYILALHVISSINYGLQWRILYKLFLFESYFAIKPYQLYEKNISLIFNIQAGLRIPFFIMPYFIVGINFTSVIYPESGLRLENEGINILKTDNFVLKPGITAKIGLDLKLKRLSTGIFYQYIVSDLNEFNTLYSSYLNAQNTGSMTVLKIIGLQSHIGLSICWYR
ncbi:MAG: hypothetical protein JXB50_11100 [Spirochaetes bacterium]|nr:hypothetical protein [Spirochaetota bacterium]